MMLPRRRASQSLETAAAWLFCETEMIAAPQLSLLLPDVEMFSFRGRRASAEAHSLGAPRGLPLTFGSLRM